MKGWLFLVIAIVGEVIATSALKSSEGFTKLAPSAVVIIGYGIAFYFLSLVLKSIPVGVAYAVWSGLGVVIITAIAWLLHGQKLDAWGFVGMGLIIAAFARPIPIVEVAAEADAMVTVFGILNLTEDSFFFDESRRLDPAGAVTAAIEMLRVGSDVVDVGPAASHPDARPVSPADEIRRIAPLLDALSDQMHRVSIDSFQPETQRYALKRGVGYLNDIQGFPDPALYPDIAEADCRLVVMHSAQRDGIATRTGHLRPEDALDEIVRFFEARVSALRRSGVAADRLILDPGMGFFLTGPAPETSLHVLSNLQKLKSALGLPLLVSVSRKSFLGATVGLPVKDLGPASLAAELHAIGNGADYVRTHAPGDLRSAITFSETLAKFRSRDARDRGLDHA
jgi:dihydropteroate synthase type 1